LALELSKRRDKGIGPSYIGELERGIIKRPEKERLVALADILGLATEQLLSLADYSGGGLEEMVQLPVGDISAGPGAWTDLTFYLPRKLVAAKSVVGYHVRGTSMEPDIPEGSLVAIDRERTAKPGDIVVAWLNDLGVVKRLMESEGQWFLVGNSSAPIRVEEGVRIEGVVIFVGRFLE
jgi:SOS-response transcriptional repressor LexA